MRRHRLEVVKPLGQRLLQLRGPDIADDDRVGRGLVRAGNYVKIRHGCPSRGWARAGSRGHGGAAVKAVGHAGTRDLHSVLHSVGIYTAPQGACRPRRASRREMAVRIARSAYAAALVVSPIRKLASVLALTSSTETPSASSIRSIPPPPFLSMRKTPRSVITMSTTPCPVSGRLQR